MASNSEWDFGNYILEGIVTLAVAYGLIATGGTDPTIYDIATAAPDAIVPSNNRILADIEFKAYYWGYRSQEQIDRNNSWWVSGYDKEVIEEKPPISGQYWHKEYFPRIELYDDTKSISELPVGTRIVVYHGTLSGDPGELAVKAYPPVSRVNDIEISVDMLTHESYFINEEGYLIGVH
jgi:hypothetical protein